MAIPKLKINRFKEKLNLPAVDRFTAEDADGYKLSLTVREDNNGLKVYVISYMFQVIGWTEDARDAFAFFNNAGAYDAAALYELARGREPGRLTDKLYG